MILLVEEVLKDFGVEYVERGNDFVIPCIFHEEKNPSFGIDKDSGIFHCFSCHAKGNFFSLVKLLTGYNNYDTILYLKNFIDDKKLTRLERHHSFISELQRDNFIDNDNKNDGIELPENVKVRSNPYLRNRGITDEEIAYWDMRICTCYPFKNWVLIPIIKDNTLRTYFLRSTQDSGKIYGYKTYINEEGERKNVGYYRSDILFGMDDCTNYNEPIVVCEGIFDAIINKRYCKQSVAALSNNILDEQRNFLKKFSEVILIPDNDESMRGMFLLDTALDIVSQHTKVSVAIIPNKFKDSSETYFYDDKNKKYLNEDYVIEEAITNRVKLIDYIVSDDYRKFMHYKKYVLKRNS